MREPVIPGTPELQCFNLTGGESCLLETERDQEEKGREPAGEWVVAAGAKGGAGWGVLVPAPVRGGTVSALLAARRLPIKPAFPAIR